MRSASPAPVITNWLNGSASKNSLAIAMVDRPADPRRDSRCQPAASAGERVCRLLAQRRGLVSTSTQPHRGEEIGGEPRRRAARRPSACRGRGRARPARTAPGGPSPCQVSSRQQADQLAEHLADLGRGGEVALRAERIARRCNSPARMRRGRAPYSRATGIGPCSRDAPAISASSGGSVARATASARPASGRPRVARAHRSSADAGDHQRQRQQHCPWSAPPDRKPSWASGSRKNSQIDAREAVADRRTRRRHRPGRFSAPSPHHSRRSTREQHDAFERRLVELARMARQRPRAVGKTKAQAHVRWRGPTARQLMKLARRPRNRPIGATAQTRSTERQDGDAAPARRTAHHGERRAEEAAMERHAARARPRRFPTAGRGNEAGL